MIDQMKAVFSIVDHSKGEEISAIYDEEKLPLRISTHGHGSADSSVLEVLGFGENRKSITICLLSGERAQYIFSVVEEKMKLSRPGHGIMFSVPVTSATSFLSNMIDRDSINNKKENEESETEMTAEHEYELVITIITKGFFPEVKAAANAAGARGGTLIHALGLGGEEAMKFLGIAIQPEKDIIFNVVRRDEKTKIMKAIADAVGINTEGRGIIFSLPVDATLGLGSSRVEDNEEIPQ